MGWVGAAPAGCGAIWHGSPLPISSLYFSLCSVGLSGTLRIPNDHGGHATAWPCPPTHVSGYAVAAPLPAFTRLSAEGWSIVLGKGSVCFLLQNVSPRSHRHPAGFPVGLVMPAAPAAIPVNVVCNSGAKGLSKTSMSYSSTSSCTGGHRCRKYVTSLFCSVCLTTRRRALAGQTPHLTRLIQPPVHPIKSTAPNHQPNPASREGFHHIKPPAPSIRPSCCHQVPAE